MKALGKRKMSVGPSFKVWLSFRGKPIIGKGGAEILRAIDEERSIAKAARRLNMSYRYIWDYLNKIEEAIGKPAVKTCRGGRGGGKTTLTKFGESILKNYEKFERNLINVLNEPEYWERLGVKLSARNRIKGVVEDIRKGNVAAEIKIRVEAPTKLIAVITREAVEELGIEPGDSVEAIIKATEVLIGKGAE